MAGAIHRDPLGVWAVLTGSTPLEGKDPISYGLNPCVTAFGKGVFKEVTEVKMKPLG